MCADETDCANSSRDPSGGQLNVPPDWADTHWSGWYDYVTWHTKHFVILEEWLNLEAPLLDCLATVKEIVAWLQANREMVRLQAIFVVDFCGRAALWKSWRLLLRNCGNMFQSICSKSRKPEFVIYTKQPNCLVALAHSLMCFHLTNAIVESGEWYFYRENVTPHSRDFDILQWWEGMYARLPLMTKCVRHTLSVPHTPCDVERTFSGWKRVRSKQQHNIEEGTHKGYVSFCVNGTVPSP